MTNLEIEAFFEIVKTGSISSAAQSLYITQPALSRRLKTLEEELGYALFDRRKGQRNTALTNYGEAFIPIAKKWQSIWQETQELKQLDTRVIRRIAAVGSVSTYLFPNVLKTFSFQNEQARICFHNYHSLESYQYIDEGLIDLAFVSDDRYHKRIETIPAWKESMMLITGNQNAYPSRIHPQMLNPQKEIRLPWNPEYDEWHNFWFGTGAIYAVSLDQMCLLENFLTFEDLWAIVPASVAYALQKQAAIAVYEIEKGPSPRIIYYLKSLSKEASWIEGFLQILNEEIQEISDLTSFL